MNELTISEKTMDSREIAELTEKRHDHVIRDIETQLDNHPKFGAVYLAGNNEERKCYKLPYRETMILISGYKVELRAKIIDRWIELEKQNFIKLPKTFSEALRLAADQAEIIEKQQAQITQSENRIKLLIHNEKTYTSTEIAKELGFKSATQLNKILEEKGIQYKVNKTWVLSAMYSGEGFESIKQEELENGSIVYNRHWTGKGRDFILNIFQLSEKEL